MTKETRQQTAGQGSTGSLIRHHASSSKNVTPTRKVQMYKPDRQNITNYVTNLARLACIAAALFCLVAWHDLFAFLVLIAIALDPKEHGKLYVYSRKTGLTDKRPESNEAPEKMRIAKRDHSTE